VCGGGFKVVVKTINYQFHNLRNTAPRRSIYGHRFCRLTKPPPPLRRYCSFNLIPVSTDTMVYNIYVYIYIAVGTFTNDVYIYDLSTTAVAAAAPAVFIYNVRL